MKDLINSTPLWYQLAILFNALLIIVSFLLPPIGIIDNSVLTAVGELGGMMLVGMLPKVIESFRNKK